MNVAEAKDFLVQQAVQQASLDGVPFSELEKRMMYFTESDDAREDPVSLNEEFEAEYDTPSYEEKISRLLGRAHTRVKFENQQTARMWDDAIRVLRSGDHYLLVLWDEKGTAEASTNNSVKGITWTVLAIVVLAGVPLLLLLDHYGQLAGSRRRGGPNTTNSSLPSWVQGVFLFLTIFGYGYYVLIPWMTKWLTHKRKSD